MILDQATKATVLANMRYERASWLRAGGPGTPGDVYTESLDADIAIIEALPVGAAVEDGDAFEIIEAYATN